METKRFAATIKKRVTDGYIEVAIEVRQRNGDLLAGIFIPDHQALRNDLRWDCGGITSAYIKRLFRTGADAARWIEEVRQHLLRLDVAWECLQREIEALPE